MLNFSCGVCPFFEQFPIQKREDTKIGCCHAKPPVIKYSDGEPESLAQFPTVISTMWCAYPWEMGLMDKEEK